MSTPDGNRRSEAAGRKRRGSKSKPTGRNGSDKGRRTSLRSHGSAMVELPNKSSRWCKEQLPGALFPVHRSLPHLLKVSEKATLQLLEQTGVTVLWLLAVAVERYAAVHFLRPLSGQQSVLRVVVLGYTCYIGRIHDHVAVIARQHTMGASGVAEAVTRLVRYWRPRLLVSSGVAAGVDKTNVCLGDVIVVREAVSTVDGRVVPGGSTMIAAFHRVRERITKWAASIVRPDGSSAAIQVVEGRMAVGNTVIRNAVVRDEIKAKAAGAIGVEMEGVALHDALSRLGVTEWLMAKGVADFADDEKDKEIQLFAALASASVVYETVGAVSQVQVPPCMIKSVQVMMLPPEQFYLADTVMLARVTKALSSRNTAIAITGSGGKGKTALSLRVAWDFIGSVDMAMYFTAETPIQVDAGVRAILFEIGYPVETLKTREATRDAFCSVLQQSDKRWLLLIDNARDPSILDGYLPNALTPARRMVLITSRELHGWDYSLTMADMSVDTATTLLVELSGQSLGPDNVSVQSLAKRMNCLPLAVLLAARYLHEEGETEQAMETLSEVVVATASDKHEAIVSAIVSVTLCKTRKPLSRLAMDMASAVAFFDANKIPVDILLRRLFSSQDRSGDDDVAKTIRVLQKRGILVYDGSASVAMHRDVVKALRSTATHRDVERAVTCVVAAVSEFRLTKPATWDTVAAVVSHVTAVAQHSNGAITDTQLSGRLATGLKLAADCMQCRGDSSTAKELIDMALSRLQQVFGSESNEAADAHTTLAAALRSMGLYTQARKHYDEALRIKTLVFGQGHVETADAITNLGNLLFQTGDYLAARARYEASLKIKESAFGDGHVSTALTINNLGAVTKELGDYAAAKVYHEKALRIKSVEYGDDHIETASALNNLGAVCARLGEHAEAKAYFLRALQIYEVVHGECHVSSIDATVNLATATKNLGDNATAKKYYELALKISDTAYGEGHISSANIIMGLGLVSANLGKLDEAKAKYQKALAIVQSVHGPGHVSCIASLGNLGNVSLQQGDFTAAKSYYAEALSIATEQLGSDHPLAKQCQSLYDQAAEKMSSS